MRLFACCYQSVPKMSNDEGGGVINNERIEIPNTLFNTIKFKICNKLTMENIMKKIL